jgi:diguanylate cyclase (GGDEF)-like protein/PAS domain S-box-containing protein
MLSRGIVTRPGAALVTAVITLGLIGAYLAVPSSGARALVWVLAGAGTATSLLLATRHHRLADPLPTWLLAAGIALLSVGQAVGLTGAASPSFADLPRLLAYPAIAAAVVAFQRDRIRHDRASLLDALVITVAAAQAGWLSLLEPVLHDDSAGLAQMAVAGAYPLGDLLVLAVVARLGFAVVGSRDSAARLIGAGLGIGVAAEVSAAVTDTPVLTVGWLLGFALLTLAAAHPTMATAPVVVRAEGLGSAWHFVLLLGLACLVSPVLFLTHQAGRELSIAVVMLGGSVLLFTLALLRIMTLLDHLRRALRREHVLRSATAALVGAADRSGVRDAALDAAVGLVDQPGSRAWRIDGDPGGTIAQATDDADVATFLDAAELALFPNAATGIDVLTGPSLLHATLGVPSTQSLVLVALPARGPAREAAVVAMDLAPSTRTIASLGSLAKTMALALERLDVGEVMLERRSERRLRLMLQYASDVICILDHDLTIVHVTPAVEPIVGMPAPELLGMNWLDVVTESDRDAAIDLVSRAQGGRPARGEVRLNSEDGHTRHVDAVVTHVIDEDLMGFVVTCHDVTERHELEEQLTHQAFHDALTGLANRALFRDRLGHAMARARADSYGVLFVDLDDFKTVNDSLGHAAGDTLLREMTNRLRGCLRDGDTAARLGGDEFAILLEDVEDDNRCEIIAQRLLEALAVPFDIDGTEVTTGASIGIAIGRGGPAAPEDLMRNADLALYDAKNHGKNRYAVFAPTMHEAALARLSLTSDLRHAIERDEITVYYQPLVDLESGIISGLEALARWEHPEHGMLQPGQFIALAEETGLIIPLGRKVLRTALFAAVRWQRTHADHQQLHMAVNVSGRQLLDPTIVDDVKSAIKDSGIDPTTVVLEITESVLLPGDTVMVDRLTALSELGVALYIDDFGTGYSSLSYLQMLPVNGLKLAQEFVETLPGGDTESGLVRTIRDLADTLGLSTIVAEGIEKPEQWSSLLSLGYRIGQGFHLAVPMPAERVPEFLSGLSNPGDGDWERSVLAAAEAAAPTAADPVTTAEAPQDEDHQDPQVAATDIGATEVAAVASAKSTRA